MEKEAGLKKAWDMLWNPAKESKLNVDVLGALKFYYKAGILGMLIYWIVGTMLISAGISIARYMPLIPYRPYLISYLSFAFLIFSGILYFLILVPIGMIINSLVYHAVGKYLLEAWNGSYEKTFAAVAFSEIPLVLFFWIILLPFVRIFMAIFAFWQIIILIVALSVQQRTSRTDAFVVILATLILSILFAILVMAFAFPSFLPFSMRGVYNNVYPV